MTARTTPEKPLVLGQMVRFTRYQKDWTADEHTQAAEAGLENIEVKLVPNPDPDKPAMVVGAVLKSVQGKIRHGDYGESLGFFGWDGGPRRFFYVLKRKLRGRRFLVLPEDILP